MEDDIPTPSNKEHGAVILRLDSQQKLVTASTNEIVHDSVTELSDTDSVTDSTVTLLIQHDLNLTPCDWVGGRSRSLVSYAGNHK